MTASAPAVGTAQRRSISTPAVPAGQVGPLRHKASISLGVNMSGVQRPGPSEITYRDYRFLITDRPTDATLPTYVEELKRRHVTDVVRVCEPTYQTHLLEGESIKVTDMQFDDGSPPPAKIIEDWLCLIKNRFKEKPEACIAVHCVAGLGRAPVMVAVALIELGMKYEDAVDFIRARRRGAINAKQLKFLEKYKPKNRLSSGQQCCIQ